MKNTLGKTCRIGVAAVVLALACGMSAISVSAADDGGYAGAFLRLDIDPRAAALGGAYTALAEGPAGFHYNPAGPAWARKRMVEASYRKMSFDRRFGSAALLWTLRNEAAVVGSWVHAGVSEVYERDLEGAIGDDIGESNNSISFTFAKQFTPFFSLGINLRYVQMNIALIEAYTVGFDFGALVALSQKQFSLGGPKGLTDVRLGLVLERINYKYPWNTRDYWVTLNETGQSFEERWPLNFRGGVSASVYERHVILAADVEINEESGAQFHAGAEVLPLKSLALRGGINGSHPAAGLGLLVPWNRNTLIVNYAFAMTDDIIDNEHLISIGVRF
jgi:hypothetical protein